MKTVIVLAALLAAAPAFASERCPEVPKDKWLRAEEVQARLQARGYDVHRVRVDGGCFEVKATKDGKRVEVHVSPADAKVVSEKVKERT